jgi:cytosine/adenosine deaminase-related metal-dependent hydrolase
LKSHSNQKFITHHSSLITPLTFSAPQIHDGHRFLPAGSVVEMGADGRVEMVWGPEAEIEAAVVFDKGILCPGFVNAHCHLELSHMRGAVPEGTGLMVFLTQVIGRRGASEEAKREARFAALEALFAAGVVAVGDIANTSDTLDVRSAGRLHFHTFVETLGAIPQTAGARLADAERLFEQFRAQSVSGTAQGTMLAQSVTAHAPYSVSEPLFKAIAQSPSATRLSVHSEESEDENEYYQRGTGNVNYLLQTLGISLPDYQPYGNSALPVWSRWMQPQTPTLLVHSTVATPQTIAGAETHFKSLFWCLCPGANRYIEGKLPPVELLQAAGVRICIGTDSLASNHALSMLGELQLLKALKPQLSWEELLTWGTRNGAEALGFASFLGTLEKGKTPGLLHIEDLGMGSAKRIV